MIDIDELKGALGIKASDPDTHSALADLEERAVAFIEAQTDRYFGLVVTSTHYVAGYGSRELLLPSVPAVAVAYIEVTERAYPGASETVIAESADDGFVLRTHGGRLAYLVRKGGGVWTAGYEYEVTYDHGYDPGDEPPDIRQLVIDMVGAKWGLRGESAGGAIASETFDRYSYRVADFSDGDLSAIPGAAATLNLWRRPVFA